MHSPRQRAGVGGAISEREREEMKSSIREQESLIHGYQKVREGGGHSVCIYTHLYRDSHVENDGEITNKVCLLSL